MSSSAKEFCIRAGAALTRPGASQRIHIIRPSPSLCEPDKFVPTNTWRSGEHPYMLAQFISGCRNGPSLPCVLRNEVSAMI